MLAALEPRGAVHDTEMPEGWERRRVKSLLREVDRRTTTGAERLLSLRAQRGLIDHIEAGGIPADPTALIGYKLVKRGELVMNRMRAATGVFGLADVEGLVSPDYALFQVGDDVEPAFLLALLRSPEMAYQMRIRSKGLGTGESGFLRLYTDAFGAMPLALPPSDEQESIVKYLAHANIRIDQAIAAKRRLASLIAEEALAEDDGDLHEIAVEAAPRAYRLKRVMREVDERSSSGAELHLSMSQRHGLVPADQVVRSLTADSMANGRLCREGDIVLNRLKAHLGVFAVAPTGGVVSADYTVLRLNDEMDADYVCAKLRSRSVRPVLRRRTKGIVEGFWRLYTPDLFSMELEIPPLSEQRRVVRRLKERKNVTDSAVACIDREIALLQEFRRRLISDVVTGKVDVRQIATSLPDIDEGASWSESPDANIVGPADFDDALEASEV